MTRARLTSQILFSGLQELEGHVRLAQGLPLQKAVTTATIDDLVPEDLEVDAFNTLWRSTSPNELTFMKLVPSTPAYAIAHEFDRIISFGEDRGTGFFGETSLPKRTNPGFERAITNIRILGETSDTFLLASMVKTVRVSGEVGAENIGRTSLLKNVTRKKQRSLIFSDTTKWREGDSSIAFKGLIQQIREGTDGTVATSEWGSHIIDMEGQPLNIDTMRAKAAKVSAVFGLLTTFLMDQFVRVDLERSMDGAQRLNIPNGGSAIMLGNAVGGMRTQGNDILFHTDTMLSPIGRGYYKGTMEDGAPSSAPTGTATAQALTQPESKWYAGDAGDIVWYVTEVRDDRESLGKTLTATVTAGQEVAFSITPSDPLSDMFRVYRKLASETRAYLAFEVANSGGGGAVAFYDTNHYRPGTGTVLGLSLVSKALEALASVAGGERSPYSLAKERSDDFFQMKDSPDNTVSVAQLGPAMGVMELAAVLATSSRPLVYSACATQVRHAAHNMVFINVGSASYSL